MKRLILHVDLDAFFASVEVRDNPKLRGKPVLVGGDGGRGVVAAASYEARKFGVFSAMPMSIALRKCPHAVVVPHRMGAYAEASQAFFTILSDFSPQVEGLSIDEAFLDLSGMERLMGDSLTIGKAIKSRVLAEVNLVASVGIAPSKFVAKIASDYKKPDGLFQVSEEELLPFLHGLPVSKLWGVGKVTQEKLATLGLRYIGDVAAYPQLILKKKLGNNLGMHLSNLAQGIDTREVSARASAISIGHEQTFSQDTHDHEKISNTLLLQADKIARRLRKRGMRAKTLTLKIKYTDFKQITRRISMSDSSSDADVFMREASLLLQQLSIAASYPIRLCGLSVSHLEDETSPRQLGFHEQTRKKSEELGKTLDSILDKFGDSVVMRASHTKPKS